MRPIASFAIASLAGVLLLGPSPVWAVPLHLTFTGTVSSTSTGGEVNGLLPGDAVAYAFFVDFAEPGQFTVTDSGGSTTYYLPGDFYARHVTGPVFPATVPIPGGDYLVASDGYVIDLGGGISESALIDQRDAYFGSFDAPDADENFDADWIYVFGYYPETLPADTYVVGRSFEGVVNRLSRRDGRTVLREGYALDLVLTDIAPVEAVPEPATVGLLAVGLLALSRRARGAVRASLSSRP